MTFTLKLAHLRALLPLAAKRDIRYYLNGVAVESHNGTLYFVATDGHRMGIIKTDAQAADCALIIPRKLIEGIKPVHLIESVELEYDEGSRIVTLSYASATYRATAIDAKFPDWRRVVPDAKQAFAPATFNVEYLADFAKVHKALSTKSMALIRVHTHGLDAALVELPSHPEFMGVLMPTRDKDEGAFNPECVQARVREFMNQSSN